MPGVTLLRPKVINAYRKTAGAPGVSGNSSTTVAMTYANLPAMLDHAARGVSDKLEWVEQTGEMVAQTDLCFVDGLMPAQFVGYEPGDTVTVDGVNYIVDSEGTGAFPDIRPFDVVVHGSNRYLVLQATPYVLVQPCLQLHLNFGRAWQETPAAPTEITVQLLTQGDLEISNGELDVNSGGDFIASGTDWTLELSSGARIVVKNGGSLAVGGAYPTLQGTNAGSVLTVDGGSLVIGETDPDDPTLSFGISAIGILNILGTLVLRGNAALTVGGASNGEVDIPVGGSLLFSASSNAYAIIQGIVTISEAVNVPDDNSIDTPNGGVLAMFTHGASGLAAEFTDASYSDGSQGVITGWAWNFGDSGTSTAQNPSHTYSAPGTYSVVLTVTTFAGATSTCTVSVTVS